MTTAQACFNLANDRKEFVGYRNNKLYYNAEGIRNQAVSCLAHRPAGFVLGSGHALPGEQLRAATTTEGDDNLCDDNSYSYRRNMPTAAVLQDGTLFGTEGKCLVKNDSHALVNVGSKGKLDLTSVWVMDSSTTNGQNRLRVGDRCMQVSNNAAVDDVTMAKCSPGGESDMGQQWLNEGTEIRSLLKNKCLNTKTMKVQTCVGSAPPNKWEFSGKLLVNKATGKCLDSNGSAVYTGGCASGNGFQHWTLEHGGTKVRHSSGKCLKRRFNEIKNANSTPYTETELYLDKCDCSEDLASNATLSNQYTELVRAGVADCANATSFGYNTPAGKCVNFVYDNPAIMANYLKWCEANQSNAAISRQCTSSMARDPLSSFNALCQSGQAILTKPMCTAMLDARTTLTMSKEDQQYISDRYSEALSEHCSKEFTLDDAGIAKVTKKYTTDVTGDDEGCLSNWTYRRPDNTTMVVKSATNIGDTSYWCRKASGVDDPLFKCHMAVNQGDLKRELDYTSLNAIWKALGASRDLPLRVYKRYTVGSAASRLADGSLDLTKTRAGMKSKEFDVLSETTPDTQIFWVFGSFRVNNARPVYSENGIHAAIMTGTGVDRVVYVTNRDTKAVSRFRQSAPCSGPKCGPSQSTAAAEAAIPNIAITVRNDGSVVEIRKSSTNVLTEKRWSKLSGLDNPAQESSDAGSEAPPVDEGEWFMFLVLLLACIAPAIFAVYYRRRNHSLPEGHWSGTLGKLSAFTAAGVTAGGFIAKATTVIH